MIIARIKVKRAIKRVKKVLSKKLIEIEIPKIIILNLKYCYIELFKLNNINNGTFKFYIKFKFQKK